jgi:hypothetical protein
MTNERFLVNIHVLLINSDEQKNFFSLDLELVSQLELEIRYERKGDGTDYCKINDEIHPAYDEIALFVLSDYLLGGELF